MKLNFDSLAKSYSRFIAIDPTHLTLNMQSKHFSMMIKHWNSLVILKYEFRCQKKLMSKIVLKMNARLIIKNHAADPEIGLLKNRFQNPMDAQGPCRQRWN